MHFTLFTHLYSGGLFDVIITICARWLYINLRKGGYCMSNLLRNAKNFVSEHKGVAAAVGTAVVTAASSCPVFAEASPAC